jgi:hypothetical protein
LEAGFSDPIFEGDIRIFLGTNHPILHFKVHERRPKHKNLKNVNRKQPSHPSPPPSHRNTFFQKFLQHPTFGTSPDWLKLVVFLVGWTICEKELKTNGVLTVMTGGKLT